MAQRMEDTKPVVLAADPMQDYEVVKMSPEDYVGRFRRMLELVEAAVDQIERIPGPEQRDDEYAGNVEIEKLHDRALVKVLFRAQRHARTMYGLALARTADAGGGWVKE